MRWASGIIVALGLSFMPVAPSVGQDTAPAAQAPAQDTAIQQTQEADKDAAPSPKAQAPTDSKTEGKGAGKAKQENTAERKTKQTKTGALIEDEAKPEAGARYFYPPNRLSNPPPVPTPAPPKKPRKVVVREGGAEEPAAQIVTGMTVEEASAQRLEAEKLLDAAEENLKRVAGRTLDAQQQETISQIHNYVERARSALREGDLSRGHRLALKADLLADDLVKH